MLLPYAVRSSVSSLAIGLFIASLSMNVTATAQTKSDASAGVSSSAVADALGALQPTMASVNLAVSSIDVHRWKVPGDVKDQTSSDVQSIQRDISNSLPGLITQAQGSSSAVAPSFAVFRNIDALYDVLLRVTETATLAGSQQEAAHLESARADLQTRRRQLGDAILSSATDQDAAVTQLRSSLAATTAAASSQTAGTGPKKTVVDDGPATTAKIAHKKKPLKPATQAAAPSAPQQ